MVRGTYLAPSGENKMTSWFNCSSSERQMGQYEHLYDDLQTQKTLTLILTYFWFVISVNQ